MMGRFEMRCLILFVVFLLVEHACAKAVLLILNPQNHSCHVTMEGVILSVALPSDAYDKHPAPKHMIVVINVWTPQSLSHLVELIYEVSG